MNDQAQNDMILAAKRIAELEATLAAMRKAAQRKLTLKATEKGGISMYGLGRFPVTLYQSQWLRLLDEAEHVRAFISANASILATKD